MYHDDKVTGPSDDEAVFNKISKVLQKYLNYGRIPYWPVE